MDQNELKIRNAVLALRYGIIDWFQYFDIVRSLPIILVALLISACGGNSGDGDASAPGLTCQTLAGTYDNAWHAGETLTINNDCTFTDSYCAYDASYTVPTSLDNGATVITVRNTNGCVGGMSSTAHMCVIEKKNGQLGLNCDSGAHLFLFNVR